MRTWAIPVTATFISLIFLALLYFFPYQIFPPQLVSPTTSFAAPTPDPESRQNLTTPVPNYTSPTPSETAASISLSVQKVSSSSAHLIWALDHQTQNNFLVLISSASSPVYPPRPGDKSYPVSDPAIHEFILEKLSGPVYFRICESFQNSCQLYSNQTSLDFSF